MNTFPAVFLSWLVVCVPLSAAAAPSPDNGGLSDAELARITAECAQRCDALFRKQSGKPLVPSAITTDWNDRGDYTREYNQSVLLFTARAFHLDEQIAEANAALRELCDYHLARPQTLLEVHSFQQVPRELVRLQRLYGPAGTRTKGLLSDETERVILKTLWAWASDKSKVTDAEVEESQTWTTISSENHHANLFSSCWAAALALAQSPEYRDRAFADGHTAAEHAAAWNAYLLTYYLERGRKGMTAEIDSPSYASATLAAAYVVHDLTDDPLLAHRTDAYMTLWWALWAQQQLDGVSGGAKARCYPDAAQHGGDFLSCASWYVMGMGRPEFEHFSMIPFVTSSWRMPDVIRDLALDVAGRGCYEVRERRPGLMRPGHEKVGEYSALRPDFGGIVRYGYCTPDFIMGSLLCEARPASDWASLSSQNRWHGVVFRGARDARIYPFFESRKSTYNQHWSVQRKGTLIGQKLQTSKHTGALRVWFSREGLTAPVERSGWFFAESDGAWAAVRVVRGTADLQPDSPARGPGKKRQASGGRILACSDALSPVILEVARKADFDSFAAFQDAVLALPLELTAGRLAYTGLSGSRFTFFTDQPRPPEIDGQVVEYAPAKVYDSPFVQSEWDSGIVMIQKGDRSLRLDFNGLPPAVGERWMPADVDWQHPVYEAFFDDARPLDDWRLEGGKRMAIEDGALVLESEPPAGDPKATDDHLVCWLVKEMPADFLLEFTVRPQNRARGLNIVFFNARGLRGESIFDPALRPRTGMFPQYHSGDLNNYHISYWAGDRGTANIRKNKGFQLVAEGKDLVGSASPDAFQTVRVYKHGGTIRLTVDDRLSAAWDDDGVTDGPVWSHSGWIGLRQMAHTGRCAYGHVKVWPLLPK